jgi:hypothetical protein
MEYLLNPSLLHLSDLLLLYILLNRSFLGWTQLVGQLRLENWAIPEMVRAKNKH